MYISCANSIPNKHRDDHKTYFVTMLSVSFTVSHQSRVWLNWSKVGLFYMISWTLETLFWENLKFIRICLREDIRPLSYQNRGHWKIKEQSYFFNLIPNVSINDQTDHWNTGLKNSTWEDTYRITKTQFENWPSFSTVMEARNTTIKYHCVF